MASSTQSVSPSEDKAPGRAPAPLRYGRMLVLALLLTFLAGFWIRAAEIITSAALITSAIPAIPALAVLLLFLLLNPLLRRLPFVRDFSRGEMVVVYVFVAVASLMFEQGVVRHIIGSLNALWYAVPDQGILDLAPEMPTWLVPHGERLHRNLYMGSLEGTVPWNSWWMPIIAWTGFLLLFCGLMHSLMLIFSNRWMDHERLAFPLVRLPMEMMGSGTIKSFFRSPLMWTGFGLVFVINIILMLSAFGGGAGEIRWGADLSGVSNPWRAIQPLYGSIRPEVVGLGYLVSTDLVFTIWISYLFQKLQGVFLASLGMLETRGAYHHQQALGGYIVLGVILLWKDRETLLRALRSWFGSPTEASGRMRWAILGVVVGLVGCFLFMTAAGMERWLAAFYLAIVVLVSLVYGRVRAETGIPLIWSLPWGRQDTFIHDLLGQERTIGPGPDFRSPTALALFKVLNSAHLSTVSGYQIEGVALGRRSGVEWKRITGAVMVAVGWGAALAFAFHLVSYYSEGVTAAAQSSFGFGAGQTRWALNDIILGSEGPKPPDLAKTLASAWGGVVVAALTLARSRWVSFPLHPIGYALAVGYNDAWFNFFIVWIIKVVVLRYGGGRTFMHLLPLFLGIALGHFISAGVLYGSLSAALGGIFLKWNVAFG